MWILLKDPNTPPNAIMSNRRDCGLMCDLCTSWPSSAAKQASEASQMAVRSWPPSRAKTNRPPARDISCLVRWPKPAERAQVPVRVVLQSKCVFHSFVLTLGCESVAAEWWRVSLHGVKARRDQHDVRGKLIRNRHHHRPESRAKTWPMWVPWAWQPKRSFISTFKQSIMSAIQNLVSALINLIFHTLDALFLSIEAVPEGSQVLRITHGGFQASGKRHVDVEANPRTAAHLQRDPDRMHLKPCFHQ